MKLVHPVFAVLALTLALPAAAQQGSGLSGIFRSVTGALGGPKQEAPPQQQNVTATLGTRGIEEGGVKSAGPASEDYALMEGWAATRPEAEQGARTKGLEARKAALKKADAGITEERK